MLVKPMLYGEVKVYFDEKGYGFIVGDDGEDYYFHYTALPGKRFRYIESGERVAFRLGTYKEKVVASWVRPEAAYPPTAAPVATTSVQGVSRDQAN